MPVIHHCEIAVHGEDMRETRAVARGVHIDHGRRLAGLVTDVTSQAASRDIFAVGARSNQPVGRSADAIFLTTLKASQRLPLTTRASIPNDQLLQMAVPTPQRAHTASSPAP